MQKQPVRARVENRQLMATPTVRCKAYPPAIITEETQTRDIRFARSGPTGERLDVQKRSRYYANPGRVVKGVKQAARIAGLEIAELEQQLLQLNQPPKSSTPTGRLLKGLQIQD